MKISYQWLHEFLDLEIMDPGWEAVGEVLTHLGLALEGVAPAGEDVIFDLEVTTNRPDWLSHLGVARELAAYYGLKLRVPDTAAPEAESGRESCPAEVEIRDPDLCPRYAARVVSGFQLGPSPDWLQRRLESLGQRPLNNIVDVTNLVLLEMGHPLHAFDFERLRGGRIVVRRAVPGERLTTLDGRTRELQPDTLLICDESEPAALAGIMGGEWSEISAATKTLLLESAYFNPASIRSTAKGQAMRSEASYRFERGADPEAPVAALNRATRLILEIAGGECLGSVIDNHPRPHARKQVELSNRRLSQVAGIDVDPHFVDRTLTALEFEVEPVDSGRRVTVPGFRVDVSIADDLAEEVLRHYGYNKLPSTYPAAVEAGAFLAGEKHDRAFARVLIGAGFREAYNLAFTNPEREREFWGQAPALVSLSNPLTEQDTHLRAGLLPGLLSSVRHNHFRGIEEVRLFERGTVFLPQTGESAPREEERLALAVSGPFFATYRSPEPDSFGFFHLKGIVEELLEMVGLTAEWTPPNGRSYLHPGISAEVGAGGRVLGCVGQVHPRLQDAWKFTQPVSVVELALTPLLERPLTEPQYKPLDRRPAVERDLSFLVDKDVQFARIESVIRATPVQDLRAIHLIDYYRGSKIPENKVSFTVRLTFVSPERTLTQEEVNEYSEKIFAALRSRFEAQLRS